MTKQNFKWLCRRLFGVKILSLIMNLKRNDFLKIYSNFIETFEFNPKSINWWTRECRHTLAGCLGSRRDNAGIFGCNHSWWCRRDAEVSHKRRRVAALGLYCGRSSTSHLLFESIECHFQLKAWMRMTGQQQGSRFHFLTFHSRSVSHWFFDSCKLTGSNYCLVERFFDIRPCSCLASSAKGRSWGICSMRWSLSEQSSSKCNDLSRQLD